MKTVARRHEFLKISKNSHHTKGQELSIQQNSMKKLKGGSECKIYLILMNTLCEEIISPKGK